MKTITINDETAVGKILNQIEIEVRNETITVRDLIKARIYTEVEAYNQKPDNRFFGLIQPTMIEAILNNSETKQKRQIDAEKQFYIALDAFTKNGFFLLVDNYQPDSLDEEILLTDSTTVSFIKLTPLVGG
ncbi:hypothetical protein [Emticicia sp. BO119]|uniref:hypothetical protein n=1 Tax=Emticicia sp. BO119 TaxID=2757768 RepID=UPI0015F11C23|nr:hypothetical protein [Emticicia sp. BO119]MBA4851103.1 hypothetical protein [Emticicia sp. BO119]